MNSLYSMFRIILSLALITCFQFTQAQTVTKAEAQAAAQKIESFVQKGDAEALAAFFDMPAMLGIFAEKSRAARDPEMGSMMDEFSTQFNMKSFSQGLANSSAAGSFHLLRTYEKEGTQRVLFRMLTGTGFNYMDFRLTKKESEVRASDVMNYLAGEDMTTILAEMIDAMVPADGELSNTLYMSDSVIIMKQMAERRDFNGVKEMYERFPPELQSAKALLMFYMEACKRISGKDYKAALEKFAQLYPNSPNAHLLMIDISSLDKDYEKTLFSINKIDEIVGGDPVLDFYRGNIYFLMQKKTECIASFEKVYAYDPELVMNIQAMIAYYVKEKEVDKARKILETYKISKTFDQKVLDLFYGKFPELQN